MHGCGLDKPGYFKTTYLEKHAGPVFIIPRILLLMCRFAALYLSHVLLSLQSIPCRFNQPPMSSASSAHSLASKIPRKADTGI